MVTITSTDQPESRPGQRRLVLASLHLVFLTLLPIGTVSTVAASTLLHVLNVVYAMLLVPFRLAPYKVTLNERHQDPTSSNLPSQVQTTEDILLIGRARDASTSTLLDARSAIGAVSPGHLIDLRAIAV